jgi:3-hydroxymyristoyl/3-hydroxydecanoyl-(acyl carrier protein) dehydratase
MTDAEFHWTAPIDHPAFAGHFPGRPIVPGVVLLDLAIQFAESMPGENCLRGRNWQVGNAKFFSPVGPEEALTFSLCTKTSRAISFTVRNAVHEVASGSLTPSPAQHEPE